MLAKTKKVAGLFIKYHTDVTKLSFDFFNEKERKIFNQHISKLRILFSSTSSIKNKKALIKKLLTKNNFLDSNTELSFKYEVISFLLSKTEICKKFEELSLLSFLPKKFYLNVVELFSIQSYKVYENLEEFDINILISKKIFEDIYKEQKDKNFKDIIYNFISLNLKELAEKESEYYLSSTLRRVIFVLSVLNSMLKDRTNKKALLNYEVYNTKDKSIAFLYSINQSLFYNLVNFINSNNSFFFSKEFRSELENEFYLLSFNTRHFENIYLSFLYNNGLYNIIEFLSNSDSSIPINFVARSF